MPCGSAVATGMRISLHNDPPVTPEEPLRNISVAATRIAPSGRVLGPGAAADGRAGHPCADHRRGVAAVRRRRDRLAGGRQVRRHGGAVGRSARRAAGDRSPTSRCGRRSSRASRFTRNATDTIGWPGRLGVMSDLADPRFLDERLAHWAETKPDDEAFTYLDRTWTWAQWDDRVRRLAGALKRTRRQARRRRRVPRQEPPGLRRADHSPPRRSARPTRSSTSGWPPTSSTTCSTTPAPRC